MWLSLNHDSRSHMLPSRQIIAESGFFQARAGRVQLTWG